MDAIKDKVDACHAQYQRPGTAIVTVVIEKTGAVSGVTTTAAFAGSPTGDCVAAAVKDATASDGLTTPYLFSLK